MQWKLAISFFFFFLQNNIFINLLSISIEFDSEFAELEKNATNGRYERLYNTRVIVTGRIPVSILLSFWEQRAHGEKGSRRVLSFIYVPMLRHLSDVVGGYTRENAFRSSITANFATVSSDIFERFWIAEHIPFPFFPSIQLSRWFFPLIIGYYSSNSGGIKIRIISSFYRGRMSFFKIAALIFVYYISRINHLKRTRVYRSLEMAMARITKVAISILLIQLE